MIGKHDVLEDKLLDILKDVENLLPESDLENIRELVVHQEGWIGVEVLCTQLDEYEQPIPAYVFSKIEAVAREMKMPSSTWDNIRYLVDSKNG